MVKCHKPVKSMPTILIYRNELLPLSETFIHGQTAAMTRFRPVYIGLRRQTPGLALSEEPILLSRNGSRSAKFRGLVYKVTGVAPSFHQSAKQLGADLLHAHFAVDGANALSLASSIRKPLVVNLHGIDVTRTDDSYRRSVTGQLYLARRRRLWNDAKLFLCDSEYLRQKALQSGFPEHKLITHYIGIDLQLFTSPEIGQQRQDVLFVGRLVEKKGCRYLIRAMQRVQAQFPSVKLLVIGDGPERIPLENLAKELGVVCDFRGAQPAPMIRRSLASARVFCAPSITASNGDSEGLGMVFAEAQAMGVPVVSSNHGGIPEVVRDGETGFLAPERDYDALADRITQLLGDDDLWHRFSSRAITWVPERFDVRRQTMRLESLYEAVIRERPVSQ